MSRNIVFNVNENCIKNKNIHFYKFNTQKDVNVRIYKYSKKNYLKKFPLYDGK